MNNARTPGKLLLFGEYTVLLGSTALALPLSHLYGQWTKGAVLPEQDLTPFARHLQQLKADGQLLAPIEVDRFVQELAKGLFFESNIPVGYGAGSSGALCAALYERYANPAIAKDDTVALPKLQRQLAQLEGFFHGESSGVDPMICYLQQPLLIERQAIRPVLIADHDSRKGRFFLIDTGISRRTAPLVQHFKAKCENDAFREAALKQLAHPTNAAVQAYLEDQTADLEQALAQISSAQLDLLPDFIPESFRNVWSAGLADHQFYLKLCGAGGGGFLIGYSPDGQFPEGIPSNVRFNLPQI